MRLVFEAGAHAKLLSTMPLSTLSQIDDWGVYLDRRNWDGECAVRNNLSFLEIAYLLEIPTYLVRFSPWSPRLYGRPSFENMLSTRWPLRRLGPCLYVYFNLGLRQLWKSMQTHFFFPLA